MSTLIVAVMAGLAPTLAIIVSYILSTRKVAVVKDVVADASSVAEEKLDSIHILVNGRLGEALNRIKKLEAALGIEPNAPVPKKGEA